MAIGELACAGREAKTRPRERATDGNGATVTLLPSDSNVATSPREDRQWAAWLTVRGSPDWATIGVFDQNRRRRRLGRAPCTDVTMEPAADQALDRRPGPGRPRTEFSAREPAEQLASADLERRAGSKPERIRRGQAYAAPQTPVLTHTRTERLAWAN